MDDALKISQQEVQRKLGCCMIRLQQYERLLKHLVATMSVAGPADKLAARRNNKAARISKETLGTLAGRFTREHLTGESSADKTGPDESSSDAPGWVRVRWTVAMSPEREEQTSQGISELVAMRNELVHHLLERFDLSKKDGCREADSHLERSYEKIDVRFSELKQLADALAEASAMMPDALLAYRQAEADSGR